MSEFGPMMMCVEMLKSDLLKLVKLGGTSGTSGND